MRPGQEQQPATGARRPAAQASKPAGGKVLELPGAAAADRDILAADPSSWPPRRRARWQALAGELAHAHGLDRWEAEAAARIHMVRGWASCPPIAVQQRADGTWPRVKLPAAVTWRFNARAIRPADDRLSQTAGVDR